MPERDYLTGRDTGDEHRSPLGTATVGPWVCVCCGVPLTVFTDLYHRCPDCIAAQCDPLTGQTQPDPRPARQPCACCGASLTRPTDPQHRCPTCQYTRCCPERGHRACGQLVREDNG